MKIVEPESDARNCFFVASLTLILAIGFCSGMRATDDLHYAKKAFHVLERGMHFADSSHQVGRIGAYLPLAGTFRLFGVNEFSLSLIPISCSVGISVFIYFLGTVFFDKFVGLMAGILFSVFPLTLEYGNNFVPEPIIGFLLCGAALMSFRAKDTGQGIFIPTKIASGILVGIAYLSTEVAAVMLPAFLIYKYIRHGSTRGAWPVVLGFILVICLELIFYGVVYDNPIYRFTKLGGEYASDPMLLASNTNLLDRLFKAYPRIFLYPQEGLGFFGLLLTAGGIKGISDFRKNSFLIVWAVSILAFYNFMSVRLDHYVALPVTARLIYPACLPLLILSAKFLVDTWRWTSRRAVTVRTSLRAIFLATLSGLIVSSLLISYARINTGFTSVIARNAEATAHFFRNEPKLVLLSDNLTLSAISFYRGFSREDTLVTFEKYSERREGYPGPPAAQSLIVIDGPIYNIPEGAGGFFPFKKTNRDLMQAVLAAPHETLFQAKFNKNSLFHTLNTVGLLPAMLGEWRYRQTRRLMLAEDATGWLLVVRRSGACR